MSVISDREGSDRKAIAGAGRFSLPCRGLALLCRGLAVALPALVLAACGSTKSGEVSETEKAITERILFGGNKLPEKKEEEKDYGCPAATMLEGTAAYRVGDAGSARGISHQASIHDLARECKAQGGTMHIKVGVQGRLILGDSGKPGSFTVPVRIAVRANGQTVYSKLLAAPVTIPADDTQAVFVVIDDEINLPITAEDPGEAYKILVGLDPQGAKASGGKKKRRR